LEAITRKKEAAKAKPRVIVGRLPAVTGGSEQTYLKVNRGEREFSRICGKLRTNHEKYPF
jgi:hypothetical protein